jgi:hypothetical protein
VAVPYALPSLVTGVLIVRRFPQILAAATAFLLAACQDGTLVLAIADAPVDTATRVNVQIAEIELLSEDGDPESFTFSPPRDVDLLQFTGGRSSILLDAVRVPEGDYTGIRLTINSDETTAQSFVDLAIGGRQPLFLPSANESRLTIDESFTIERRKELDLTIHIDLRQSVLPPEVDGEPFELKPVWRLIRTEDVATLSGTVSDALATGDGCSPAIYLFAGHDAEPNDAGSNAELVASAKVELGSISGDFDYEIAFLEEGEYTVAFTCDALDDDPRIDELPPNEVIFAGETDVTLTAGETATVNFQ